MSGGRLDARTVKQAILSIGENRRVSGGRPDARTVKQAILSVA